MIFTELLSPARRRERREGALTSFRVEERARFLEIEVLVEGGRLVGVVVGIGGSSCFLSSSLTEMDPAGGCGIGGCVKAAL